MIMISLSRTIDAFVLMLYQAVHLGPVTSRSKRNCESGSAHKLRSTTALGCLSGRKVEINVKKHVSLFPYNVTSQDLTETLGLRGGSKSRVTLLNSED